MGCTRRVGSNRLEPSDGRTLPGYCAGSSRGLAFFCGKLIIDATVLADLSPEISKLWRLVEHHPGSIDRELARLHPFSEHAHDPRLGYRHQQSKPPSHTNDDRYNTLEASRQ